MKFWDIVARTSNEAGPARMTIYGNMGRWSDVDERLFVSELDSLNAPALDVYVGSGGGSVQTGLVIYNALRRFAQRGTLRTHADGMVASAATLPFLAGDERHAPVGSLVMVHQALTQWAEGNADDLREHADVLEKITESIADVYAARTGIDKAQALAMMKAETWLTAAQAVEAGFATHTTEAVEATAMMRGDVLNALDGLPSMPAAVVAYVLQHSAKPKPAAPVADAINVQPAGPAGTKKEEGSMNLEKLKAEHADVHAAAMAAGAQAERQRIKDIQAATPAGFEADAQAAIEAGQSPEVFALALLRKQKEAGTTFLNQRAEDAQEGANSVAGDDGHTNETRAQAEAADFVAMAAAGMKRTAGIKS